MPACAATAAATSKGCLRCWSCGARVVQEAALISPPSSSCSSSAHSHSVARPSVRSQWLVQRGQAAVCAAKASSRLRWGECYPPAAGANWQQVSMRGCALWLLSASNFSQQIGTCSTAQPPACEPHDLIMCSSCLRQAVRLVLELAKITWREARSYQKRCKKSPSCTTSRQHTSQSSLPFCALPSATSGLHIYLAP